MSDITDDNISQYWNQLEATGPSPDVPLDLTLAETIGQMHSLSQAPTPGSARERARQRIFASESRSQEFDMSTLLLQPPSINGRAALSPPVPFPKVPSVPKPPILARRALLYLAAAILIAFAGFGGYFAQERFLGDDSAPAVIPAVQETPTGDWPMYMGSPARTRVMPGTGPKSTPVEVWRVQLSGSGFRSPAVVGDTAYVGTSDGILYALDANTGAEKWQFQGDSSLEMTPTWLDGTVYVPSQLGTMYALDAATGQEKWRFAKPLAEFASPTFGDGLLFAGSEHDNHLYAIDPATGAEVWSFEATDIITRGQAYADGVVYSGSEIGILYALNAQDGMELWRYDAGDYIPTPAIVDGVAYTTSTEGQVIMVDIATGKEIRRIAMDSVEGIGHTPLVSDGILYAGGYNGSVIALEVATGETVWVSEPAADLARASLALVDGVIYAASFDTTLRAFDAETGAELWTYTVDGTMNHGPTIANGLLYASTDAGTIYAIGDGDGSAIATPEATAAASESSDFATFLWASDGGQTEWSPVDLAVQADGNIAVGLHFTGHIIVLSPEGNVVDIWGEPGTGEGQFLHPGAIAFDADDNAYVADVGRTMILKFGPDREFLGEWGAKGSEDGQLLEPNGLAIDAEGNIIVSDFARNDLQVFTPDGDYLRTIGGPGSEPGQFDHPNLPTVDADGNIWVADDFSVSKFAPDGTFLLRFGSRGAAPGQFNQAFSVQVDAEGRVFVGDNINRRVQVFDTEGNFLFEWGDPGPAEDQFQSVFGVELDRAGNVYIANPDGHRVQKFQLTMPD